MEPGHLFDLITRWPGDPVPFVICLNNQINWTERIANNNDSVSTTQFEMDICLKWIVATGDLTLLDISATDTVDNDVLLCQLCVSYESTGLSLQWFTSYLLCRPQLKWVAGVRRTAGSGLRADSVYTIGMHGWSGASDRAARSVN